MGDDAERTCYVNNFHEDVTSELIEELFTQVGPLEKVIWKDVGYKYALVVFEDEESVPFAIETLNEIRLFGQQISVKPKSGTDQHTRYEEWCRKKSQNRILSPQHLMRNLSRSGGRQNRTEFREHREATRPSREENWRQAHTPHGRPGARPPSRGPPLLYEHDNWNGGGRCHSDPRDREMGRHHSYTPPAPPPGYREPKRENNRDGRDKHKNNRGFGGPNIFNKKSGGRNKDGGQGGRRW